MKTKTKITYKSMKELSLYDGSMEIVDTKDQDLVNIVITIPMDRGTAAYVCDRIAALD